MGIPHLTLHLRPYADYTKNLSNQDVVIDGPALAYHIYLLCLTLRPGAKNAFEAAPTYAELGEAVTLWLGFLQPLHLTVKKIFFDGFLPTSKKEVRLQRLETYTKQLRTYSAASNLALPSGKKVVASGRPLLDGAPLAKNAQKIPAAAFQVSAILDALVASEKYRHMVQVVPDEADAFCASYVRAYGGVILTGDSDLLIYDLGPSGSVIFFRDLEVRQESGKLNIEGNQIFHLHGSVCHHADKTTIATQPGCYLSDEVSRRA